MNRRRFIELLKNTAAGAAATQAASFLDFGVARASPQPERPQQQGPDSKPRIAVTMDDPSVAIGPSLTWQEANRRLLECFHRRGVQIALFVCGMRVDQPDGAKLLADWDKAGHLICSHSYSHWNFNAPETTYEKFAADFLRNEPVISSYAHRIPLFRFPLLKEGDSGEKRDAFRALLKKQGYRNGHVTIDASDWYVDDRMRSRLASNPGAAEEPYRDYLISHLLDRAAFYRELAIETLHREIPHTILVHYRPLEALFLGNVMDAFEKAGWEWISAERAFEDPIFQRQPQTVPAGESLVWALAKETGHFNERLRYPGEDDGYEKPKMDALGL